jgi:hypothetical protein
MERPQFGNFSPLQSEADILVADVLGRIQASPAVYEKANERYHTQAEWLERDGSPLKGKVELVYGQGGVSQGSSIAARGTNDEFDVDAMVQLHPSIDLGPDYVLDLLYITVKGERGSRYHDVTTRCTRCVQVQYADKMHIDLTPAILQPGVLARQSTIFHHRAETPTVPGKRVTANPFGFTRWFKDATPPEPYLIDAFDSELRALAKADAEPLPQQVGPHGMSRALASLQLIKRFRNLRYDRRDCRCPPSVLLAKLVADYRAEAMTLAAALLEHAIQLRGRFVREIGCGRLIHEVNPAPCQSDVLTDRWPSSMQDQLQWAGDLDHLVTQLTIYVHRQLTLKQRQDILGDLFGEQAAKSAMHVFTDRLAEAQRRSGTHYQPGTGRLVLPAAVAASTASQARPMPSTKYFGGERCEPFL